MKVQTFMGKVSIEGLHQMDAHLNEWMQRQNLTPLPIHQCFGTNNHHDSRAAETIVVTSVWYQPSEVD